MSRARLLIRKLRTRQTEVTRIYLRHNSVLLLHWPPTYTFIHNQAGTAPHSRICLFPSFATSKANEIFLYLTIRTKWSGNKLRYIVLDI
jgi:hypothetical protein